MCEYDLVTMQPIFSEKAYIPGMDICFSSTPSLDILLEEVRTKFKKNAKQMELYNI